MSAESRRTPKIASQIDRPMQLLGAWHLLCAITGGVTLVPSLPLAIRHPIGWLTLALLAVSALIGVALVARKRSVLRAATVLQAAQVLAVALPGAAVWIVRVGLQLSLSIPPIPERSLLSFRHDTTVFTIWGTGAQLPLGISVNILALLAFAVCLTCLPDRTGTLQPDSA